METAFLRTFMPFAILVFLASELAVAVPAKKTPNKHILTPFRPLESRLGGGMWKDHSVYHEDGVFTKTTDKPASDSWSLPEWGYQTMPPWADTGSNAELPFEQYNSPSYPIQPDMDLSQDGAVVAFATPVPPADVPDVQPVHIDVGGGGGDSGGGGGGVPNLWGDEEARMGGYTWITMAVVLVVFFKMTVLAIIIARRMRQRQHRALSQSTNSSCINIPSEFASDQAHLVTPASIVYIDPNDDRPPPLPNLFTPPPYSESLLAQSTPPPATPAEAPPPYSR